MSPTDLQRVDPAAPIGPASRAYVAFLRTSAGRWTAINIAPKVDPWLLRVTGGRIGMALMLPSTLLTTTGAKSRLPRTHAVLYFHDGADVIVIASSYGREHHPAWYFNPKAHPEVRVGSHPGLAMTAAEVTEPAEQTRLWALADRVYPLFADYRDRAARTDRVIPIIRLTEAGGDQA